MNSSLNQYESGMLRILTLIHEGKDLTGLSPEDLRILKYCCDEKMVDGIVMIEMISGRLVIERREARPYLTHKGLQFLENTGKPCNSPDNEQVQQPAKRLLDPLKKIWKFIFACLGGLATILGIIQGWPLLQTFWSKILSWFSS